MKSSYKLNQILWRLCKFVTLILHENYVKSLRVTKIVKEIKFEGDGSELDAKHFFEMQSLPKYMRQTYSSIAIFEQFFASIGKVFILGGRLDTRV